MNKDARRNEVTQKLGGMINDHFPPGMVRAAHGLLKDIAYLAYGVNNPFYLPNYRAEERLEGLARESIPADKLDSFLDAVADFKKLSQRRRG